MTRRNLAMLVCRAMAIYVFYQALLKLEIVSAGALQMYRDWAMVNRPESMAIFFASFVPFAGLLVMSLVLWFKASRIARRMVAGLDGDDETDRLRLDYGKSQRLILFGLGAFITAMAIPSAGYFAAIYITVSTIDDELSRYLARLQYAPGAVQASLQLTMGMALMAIARLLGKRGGAA